MLRRYLPAVPDYKVQSFIALTGISTNRTSLSINTRTRPYVPPNASAVIQSAATSCCSRSTSAFNPRFCCQNVTQTCVFKPVGVRACVECVQWSPYTQGQAFLPPISGELSPQATKPIQGLNHMPIYQCLVRGQRGRGQPPQRRGGCSATRQRFSRGPMSDYLGAPVIIQCDLNLPATLWFDGSAHSLGIGFAHVKHRQITTALSVALTKENLPVLNVTRVDGVTSFCYDTPDVE